MERLHLECYQPCVLKTDKVEAIVQFRHYDARKGFNELRIADAFKPWIENGDDDSEMIVDCSDPTIEWRPLTDEENGIYLAELDKRGLWIDPLMGYVCHKGMTVVNFMGCYQEAPCANNKEECRQDAIEGKARFYEMLAQDVREHPDHHGF